MEDLPWEVKCVNRITGESRDVPYGEFNENRGYCNQPEEYKVTCKTLLLSFVTTSRPQDRQRNTVSVRVIAQADVRHT